MLMNAQSATLLMVDLQTRLLPHIAEQEDVLAQAIWLAQVARRVGVPMVLTEQNREKLGGTHPDLLAVTADAPRIEKIHFSAVAEGCFSGSEVDRRPQVVICGTESHVCVQQTALELRWQGKHVFVVSGAVGSRQAMDKHFALERMRSHGIEIVSREMVAFEWLGRAGSDVFRDVSRNFIR